MALATDAIGKKIGPVTKNYTWKDVILYALGVGAGFNELEYAYEKKLKVIPTFSIAMIFDFFREVAATGNINVAGVLHGAQDIVFHVPIPTSGTMTTEGKITHYYDKGAKGALVVAESETVDASGKKLFTSTITLFSRLDGGFGGKDAPQQTLEFPDREPDFVVEALPLPDQPLLYRLSGDTFELHVDGEFAKMAGFEKPIMHGLCTFGFACRALMASLTPGKPGKVRRVACRFASALYPGEPIKTMIWKTNEGKAVWRTVHAYTGGTIIDRGIFEYGELPKEETRFDGPAASVAAVFEKMPGAFRSDTASDLNVVFQFIVSGEGGGNWYVEIKGESCKVEAGIYTNPSCAIQMEAADFLDMINGRLPAIQAFTSGKLKIQGDLMKAQLIGKLFKF